MFYDDIFVIKFLVRLIPSDEFNNLDFLNPNKPPPLNPDSFNKLNVESINKGISF